MKIQKTVLLLIILLSVSCATTYKDFKMKNLSYKESVAIGKINITYNGQKFNKECNVCLYNLVGQGGPCQKLSDEGLVFLGILKGPTSLGRIECIDTSVYHYNPIGLSFNQADDVTYFGEINIDWENDGGFKSSDMFGLVGAIISESKVYGKLQTSIKNGDRNSVVNAFKEQIKQNEITVVDSIMTSKK